MTKRSNQRQNPFSTKRRKKTKKSVGFSESDKLRMKLIDEGSYYNQADIEEKMVAMNEGAEPGSSQHKIDSNTHDNRTMAIVMMKISNTTTTEIKISSLPNIHRLMIF